MKNITIKYNGNEITGKWNEKTYNSRKDGCIRIYLDGTQYDIDKEENFHLFEEANDLARERKVKQEKVNKVKKVYDMLYTSTFDLDVVDTYRDENIAVFFYEMDSEYTDEVTEFFNNIGIERHDCGTNYYFDMNLDTYNRLNNSLHKDYIEMVLPYSKYKRQQPYFTVIEKYDPETKTIKVKATLLDCLSLDVDYLSDEDIEKLTQILDIFNETTTPSPDDDPSGEDNNDTTENNENMEDTKMDNKITYDLLLKVKERVLENYELAKCDNEKEWHVSTQGHRFKNPYYHKDHYVEAQKAYVVKIEYYIEKVKERFGANTNSEFTLKTLDDFKVYYEKETGLQLHKNYKGIIDMEYRARQNPELFIDFLYISRDQQLTFGKFLIDNKKEVLDKIREQQVLNLLPVKSKVHNLYFTFDNKLHLTSDSPFRIFEGVLWYELDTRMTYDEESNLMCGLSINKGEFISYLLEKGYELSDNVNEDELIDSDEYIDELIGLWTLKINKVLDDRNICEAIYDRLLEGGN